MAFLKTNKDLFFSKNDPHDPRLGDLVNAVQDGMDLKDVFVIGGYPDDEGIKNSGGRLGASGAPQTIRKFLYRMTPHLISRKSPRLADVGDFEIKGALDQRQAEAMKEVSVMVKSEAKWIGLGGGHDWGYVDGSAYLEYMKDQKERPLIINFDAHLDVRPDTKGTNSGTPFYKLLSKYNDIDFYEIGIQSQCNSKTHHTWLIEKSGRCLFYDELLVSGQSQAEQILKFLSAAIGRRRKAYISVDIDAFSSAWAPGCSQSFATGLIPDDFFRVLEVLKERLDIRVFGIYEVSPPLDLDDRTSKLAALILHRLIY